MLGSQTMTLALYQVVPYPSLEENDEHIETIFFSTTKGVPFPPFEDDDVSSFDEDDDQMEEIPTNWYMEQTDEFLDKMNGLKNINRDPLMEDNLVEFPLDEENH